MTVQFKLSGEHEILQLIVCTDMQDFQRAHVLYRLVNTANINNFTVMYTQLKRDGKGFIFFPPQCYSPGKLGGGVSFEASVVAA